MSQYLTCRLSETLLNMMGVVILLTGRRDGVLSRTRNPEKMDGHTRYGYYDIVTALSRSPSRPAIFVHESKQRRRFSYNNDM